MGSGQDWDAQKMLERYIHDYLVKKNMYGTAETFKREADVGDDPVSIDSPEGFLHEWWSAFNDIYNSREPQLQQQGSQAEASVKAEQLAANQLQNAFSIVPMAAMNYLRSGEFPFNFDYAKMFGKLKQTGHLSSRTDPNSWLLDVGKLNLTKSAGASSSYLGQQSYNQLQQQAVGEERFGINIGRAVTIDPTLHRVQKSIFSIAGHQDSVPNNGVNSDQLNGLPLNANNSLVSNPQQQQLQMLAAQCQPRLLPQARIQTLANLTSTYAGSSSNVDGSGVMVPTGNVHGNDPQMIVRMKKAIVHQNQNDQQHLQQLLENRRKKKKLSHSGAGDETGNNAEDDKAVDENIESFFSNDYDIADPTRRTPFGVLNRSSVASNKNEHQGFSFQEVGCLHSTKHKVFCCDFSADGKFLASAGHQKKVSIWNMDTFDFVTSSEGHSLLVTDIRFSPQSSIFATSSFDRTVQIWDAAMPDKSLWKLFGHSEQVMSLDFHPRTEDLLCSCDTNNVIRLWNVKRCACVRASKGATKQVRFQPQVGKLLATAAGNHINVIDVETDQLQNCLEGHTKEILSICWDPSGKYIASVSEDSARLWSTESGGKLVKELKSYGNKFRSCTFHPGHSLFLIIGGYQSLEFWNPTESNRVWTVEAHKGVINSLASSIQREMVASASHDQCVKIWK